MDPLASCFALVKKATELDAIHRYDDAVKYYRGAIDGMQKLALGRFTERK